MDFCSKVKKKAVPAPANTLQVAMRGGDIGCPNTFGNIVCVAVETIIWSL